MKNGIYISNIWSDESVLELRITAKTESIEFTNKVYTCQMDINQIVKDLNRFKNQIYGGLLDIQLGTFGEEYANGAIWGRLQFQSRGQIHITLKMESDFREFGKRYIADEAKFYMITEPALLDEFISSLSLIYEKEGNKSILGFLE